jgi:hypothetical protein
MNLVTKPDNIDTKVLHLLNPLGFKMRGKFISIYWILWPLGNEFYESHWKYYPDWLYKILKNLVSELIHGLLRAILDQIIDYILFKTKLDGNPAAKNQLTFKNFLVYEY